MPIVESPISESSPSSKNESWSVADSALTYRIREWGSPYFSIDQDGNVTASISEEIEQGATQVPLIEVIAELKRRGVNLPAIVRFPYILKDRACQLIQAFEASIEKSGYQGSFNGCFPIKVNQKREVLHELASLNSSHHLGFEAGTKAELLIAISQIRDRNAFIVCNGYKDRDFIDLALYATKAGLNLMIVVERTDELDTILSRSDALGILPRLGVRARIATKGAGRWASTSGGQGLFGLTALELIRTIDRLKLADRLDCLKMLHFHQGSQIPDLATIQRGIEEASTVFRQICSEGAPLEVINVGGGLAIDYEGSGIASHSSRNYSLEEYCHTIVETISRQMDAHDLPHPQIVSESGRAIASHHSVLIFDVFGAASSQRSRAYPPKEKDPEVLKNLFRIIDEVTAGNALEKRRQAEEWLEECHDSFKSGDFDLRKLAAAQRLCSCITDRIRDLSTADAPISPALRQHLSDYYYANFSVFRSIPDSWAIGQLFPVMPIHRHQERPHRSAVIADITCDCDGKIRHYIGPHDELDDLPVHTLRPGEPYYHGVFLVGSYQETLGDIHNLIGEPAVITVRVSGGEVTYDCTDHGDTVSDILRQVDHDRATLLDNFVEKADDALSQNAITADERDAMSRLFDEILDSTTYLKPRYSHPES